MSRRLASPRFWLMAALIAAAGAGAAFAATSLSGFTLDDTADTGVCLASSPSGYSSYAVYSPGPGGGGSSPSGFAAYTGPAAPISTGSTAVEDWKKLND